MSAFDPDNGTIADVPGCPLWPDSDIGRALDPAHHEGQAGRR